ncbi:hypothetical protein [Sediminibacterium soli]|uniref:hypothetical protein n=1 Tax=Sediminibacterium soli TaxID=2698829 RepID=UPI001379608E|nr:hypothetical protein [Sediminibacterium soli]NCI45957.1 hypothetical protein [Sediminibacterium soli]
MPVSTKRQVSLTVLSPEEIRNPLLVADELFDFADIDDVRRLLWLWLKTSVTGGFQKQLGRPEREAILELYEKLEKLVEAAYLLQQAKRS